MSADKDNEIERLARIMCRCEGVDPETTAACIPLATNGRGLTFVPQGSTDPAWHGYARLARGIVDSYPKVEVIPPHPPEYRGTDAAWFAELIDIAYKLVMPRMQIALNEGSRHKLVRQLRNHLKALPEEYS